MSEKKRLEKEHDRKVKELQENCQHPQTIHYSNHRILKSDYCLRCGKVINIKLR